MYFPGELYVTYIQNPHTNNYARRFFDAGIKRVIFSEMPNFDWPMYYDEVCFYRPEIRKMRSIVNSEMSEYPVFEMQDGTLEEFMEIIESRPSKVFIYCNWGSPTSKNVSPSGALKGSHRYLLNRERYFAKKFRWLYEAANEYRGVIQFIAFGRFDYETYYHLGLSGGARIIKRDDKSRIYPDGTEYLRIAKEHKPEFAHLFDGVHHSIAAVNCILHTPSWIKSYYNIIIPPVSPSAFNTLDVKSGYVWRSSRQLASQMRHTKNLLKRPANSHRPLYNDGVRCDTCSLSYACRFYRPLGICTLPGSEGSELVKKFQSDNVEDIIKGISSVLGAQAELTEESLSLYQKQLKNGVGKDEVPIKYSDVRQEINDLIKNGIAVAKLKQPPIIKPVAQTSIEGIVESEDGMSIESRIAVAIDNLGTAERAELVRKMTKAGFKAEEITPANMFAFMRDEHQPQLPAGGIDDDAMPF